VTGLRTRIGLTRPWVAWGLLLVVGAGVRLVVFAAIPPGLAPGPLSYAYALQDHFWDLLGRATLLPPLNYPIQALPILVLGTETNAALQGTLYMHGLLGLGAAGFLHAAMRLVSVPAGITWGLALACSLALIPLEVWGARFQGGHYDVPTPFFMAALIWALAAVVRRGWDRRRIVMLGVAGCALMLQMATAAYFLPVMLVAIVLVDWWMGRLGPRPWRVAGAVLVPVLVVVAALSVRNGLINGIYSPGARGGAPMLMFVQSALGGDAFEVRRQAVAAGVPAWWLWCYDHAELQPDVPAGGMWDGLSRAFGTCASWGPGRNEVGQPWPLDFATVQERLESFGRPDLAALVARDRVDATRRQYLLTGHSPELSPRWMSIYGAQSQRVGMYLLRHQPLLYLKTAWRHHRDLFWGKGPEFFGTLTYWAGWEFPFRDGLAQFARFWFPAVTRAAYVLLPLAVLMTAWRARLWRRRGTSVNVARHAQDVFRFYLWLALPVIACALIYTGAVAVENERYFLQIVPMLVVAFGCLVRDVSRMLVGGSDA